MYSFAGLIRRTPPPTFSDTAITDRHSNTTICQLRVHWVRISWSIGSEKSFGHVPPLGVEPSNSCVNGEHPIHQTRRSAVQLRYNISSKKKKKKKNQTNVYRVLSNYNLISGSSDEGCWRSKNGHNSMHFEKKKIKKNNKKKMIWSFTV